MKKLVLFFAVAVALSFAACNNAPKPEETPEATQAEQVVNEVPAADEAAPAADEAAPVAAE